MMDQYPTYNTDLTIAELRKVWWMRFTDPDKIPFEGLTVKDKDNLTKMVFFPLRIVPLEIMERGCRCGRCEEELPPEAWFKYRFCPVCGVGFKRKENEG